jgi:mRNA interferase HigB
LAQKNLSYFPNREHFIPLTNFRLLRVIARRTLRLFWEQHPDSEQSLKAWFQDVEKSSWDNPNEIKAKYPSASILGDSRVTFNIKGNHYRLIVKINYDYKVVWIRFVGTHAEYDKIDAKNI